MCAEKKCRTNTVWGYMIVLKHIVSISRNDGTSAVQSFCRVYQLSNARQGKVLEYVGELYSEEHKRKLKTEKAGIQVLKDPMDGMKNVLAIDRKPIGELFKEQFDKLRQNIHRPMQ